MTEASEDVIKKVETDLQELCRDVIKEFKRRFSPSSFMQSVQSTFGNMPSILPTDINANEALYDFCLQNVTNILEHFPGPKKEYFEDLKMELVSEIGRFYNFWLDFVNRNKNNESADTSIEKVYSHYYQSVKTIPESQIFTEFFENIMIRTCSEAMVETVGSIMGIALAKGRNTHPVNFEKEIKLRFNLPPLHLLTEHFIPELVEEIIVLKETE